MESQSRQVVFSNRLKVTRSITPFDPVCYQSESGSIYLLCANSTYGHNIMDGKLQILKFDSQTMNISEKHFIETTAGVSCAKFF